MGRLLRLRSLLEDVSRLELEVRLQELAQIETGVAHLEEDKKINRRRSFEGFGHAENASWVEAEALVEIATWQQEMLAGMHQKKTAEVEAAKAIFLERRKESRQAESVVEARATERAIQRNRREQRSLDDWFNQRSK
jgi:flagellar export protein FliJ